MVQINSVFDTIMGKKDKQNLLCLVNVLIICLCSQPPALFVASVVFVDLYSILYTDVASLTKLGTIFLCTNCSHEKREFGKSVPLVVHNAVVVIRAAQTVDGTSAVFLKVVLVI